MLMINNLKKCGKYLCFLSFLLLVCSNKIYSQYISKGGGAGQDEALDIATDAAGNSYITGYFTSSITFEGGISLNSTGLSDIFLLKANSSGQILWAIKVGGMGDERANSIAVDASGNVYVTGHFQGTVDFGGDLVTSNGTKDMFVAKYSTLGILQWVNSGGGNGEDFGLGVSVDGAGNVAVTGEFKNTAIFGGNTFVAGDTDVFICRYTTSGILSWAKAGSGQGNARGIDIACDIVGNIYVTGQFTNDITFDNTEINNMYNAVFLVKFNAAGNEQWLRKIGGGATNIAYGICSDANSNIYITGDFTGNLVFFPNVSSPLTNQFSNKIFLAKYNTAGSLLWSKAAGSTSEISSRGVAVSNTGKVYIGGWFKCKFSQYADEYGQGIFNSLGFRDGFVSTFNSSGNWEFARHFGATGHDYLNSIAVDGGGAPVMVASYNDVLFMTNSQGISIPPNTLFSSSNPSFLCGDVLYNSFVRFSSSGVADIAFGNLIQEERQPLDYYSRFLCSLPVNPMCIQGIGLCSDTMVSCGAFNIHADTYNAGFGPTYEYLWNTPGNTQNKFIQQTGQYRVTVNSIDGCYSQSDSVYVKIYPQIPSQQILDNHGFNPPSSALGVFVTPIKICPPDTVLITGIPHGVDTFYWSANVPYTTINDSVIQTSQPGDYIFNVIDSNGCSGWIGVKVVEIPMLPVLHPYLSFVGDNDLDDSISICQGEMVRFTLKDSLLGNIPCNNSNLITNLSIPQLGINTQPSSGCSGGFIGSQLMYPTQSSWYTVYWDGVYANHCDTVPFSVMDSIYITVNPNPIINISWNGPTTICPGDSVLFVASGTTDIHWSGTPVISGGGTNEVWVSGEGTLILTADSITAEGCSTHYYQYIPVHLFVNPVLTSNPQNALVCPNDSVLLTVTGGPLYQWFGPQGLLPQNTQSIYVTLPGFYYCAVTDTGSCLLFSNSIEVLQYTTPFLLASPSPILCNQSDTALIYVVTNIGSSIQWNAPFSGNDSLQVVDSPGIYSVTITSCNIATVCEIIIDTSTVSSAITTTNGLTFCDGDSVLLEASGNDVEYFIWNPGNYSGGQYTVLQQGVYTVTGVDEYGCAFQSLPIQVVVTPNNSIPPIVNDTIFCAPSVLQITAIGQGTIMWFADSLGGVALDSGSVFQAPILTENTTYYVMNSYGGCSSTRVAVVITVSNCDEIEVPNIFTPNGDGINDYFTYNILGTTCFDLFVVNRWGVKVFESHEPQGSWNGKVMNVGEDVVDGTYFYIVEFCPQNGGFKKQTGIITVIKD